ncbi:hypothetical protein [Deinococcus cellulosilyticus]|uniref:Uncharacterized protein n=1 Tax=Deinococcus cellulosilyticus (strain DSM 18568 / NBRC 106333 / KACC 11606 / 5516J-15) TaxID=1223518 RepID=A0A511N8T9_DEIC1|nr:hypothetical protein [Deinococcus cellulosilyticus]GEM48898.1 hypothetical protein DC3_45330 [Deinococcus cellulosilyticus NBRC 106333 = KACC 11606]
MVKALIAWVKHYFEQTRIQALEIRPVWVEKGEIRECAYGSENAYGLYQKDTGGLFLKEHLTDYHATRKLAYAEAEKYGVQVVDLVETADLQRVRDRFKIGESKSASYLSDVI